MFLIPVLIGIPTFLAILIPLIRSEGARGKIVYAGAAALWRLRWRCW